jgi:hypothetical protein
MALFRAVTTPMFDIDADPDPNFYFDVDPDPAFHSNANTDPILIWLPKMMRIHAKPCPDPQYYQTPENDDSSTGGP